MDVENKPYSKWLEDALTALFALDPVNIGLVARMHDGKTMTAYYNCDAEDKALMAHHIQSDVTMDIIESNAGRLKALFTEEDNG